MNKTQKQVVKILTNLALSIRDGRVDAELIEVPLYTMLDELLSDDIFGTEGENDPRGDKRG